MSPPFDGEPGSIGKVAKPRRGLSDGDARAALARDVPLGELAAFLRYLAEVLEDADPPPELLKAVARVGTEARAAFQGFRRKDILASRALRILSLLELPSKWSADTRIPRKQLKLYSARMLVDRVADDREGLALVPENAWQNAIDRWSGKTRSSAPGRRKSDAYDWRDVVLDVLDIVDKGARVERRRWLERLNKSQSGLP